MDTSENRPPRRMRRRRRATFPALLLATFAIAASFAGAATASPADPNFGHKVTLCHATGSASNPYVVITVDVAAGGLKGGHQNHSRDIIPAFVYVDKGGVTHSYPGKNLGTGASILANGCKAPTPPPPPPPPPTSIATDVCPNIDGDQAAVPTGLIVNAAGDCVAPAVAGSEQGPEAPAPSKPAPAATHTPAQPTAVAGASATPAATAGATGNELPFTGLDTTLMLLLGVSFLLGGALLSLIGFRKPALSETD